MTALLFYVGKNCYGIETCAILRIIPNVSLKKISYSPNYLAGLLNLGGKLIPVIDFCELIEHRKTETLFHSRIVLIKNTQTDSNEIVGILGEKVEEIVDLQSEKLKKTDLPLHYFAYLHEAYSEGERMIQLIDTEEFFHFLSTELFKELEEGKHEL